MKQLANIIVGSIFMLVLAAGLRHVFEKVRGAITGEGITGLVLWQTDWTDAVAQAAARHKMLLVEFARDGSPACRELAKTGWSRMDIVTATSDFVPVLVDIEAHPDLARQFSIATVPSLAVIDPQSQTIVRDGRDQHFSPDDLLLWLNPDAHPKWNTSFPQNNAFGSQSNSFQNQQSPFSQ